MDALAVSILGGLLRAGIAAAGGYLVQKGLADGGVVTQAAGYAGVAAAAGWSWFNKIVLHREIVTAAVTGTVKK